MQSILETQISCQIQLSPRQSNVRFVVSLLRRPPACVASALSQSLFFHSQILKQQIFGISNVKMLCTTINTQQLDSAIIHRATILSKSVRFCSRAHINVLEPKRYEKSETCRETFYHILHWYKIALKRNRIFVKQLVFQKVCTEFGVYCVHISLNGQVRLGSIDDRLPFVFFCTLCVSTKIYAVIFFEFFFWSFSLCLNFLLRHLFSASFCFYLTHQLAIRIGCFFSKQIELPLTLAYTHIKHIKHVVLAKKWRKASRTIELFNLSEIFWDNLFSFVRNWFNFRNGLMLAADVN